MIRINLLPIKQDRRKEAGRNQILIGLLVLALEGVVLAFLYLSTVSEATSQKNANGAIQSQVDRLKNQVKDHKKILAEIAEYEKRQAAIDDLLAARTGPVFVMLELSNILSKDGRPHIDHDAYQQLISANPALAHDESWDHRRLWLDTLVEKDRQVKLTGQGLTHEDVAEFLRRINLSRFFVSSSLISTNLAPPKISKEGFDAGASDPVVQFVVQAVVRYK